LYNFGVSRDHSISDSAWESIFQMNVDFHFTTSKLGFLNIMSEYPSLARAKYGIQMDPSVTERSRQSGKKHVLYMLGLLSTIIRGKEQCDQESVTHEKIALANEHN